MWGTGRSLLRVAAAPPRNSSSTVSRARATHQRSPSTTTSAARGREL